ncbi:MAG: Na+ dependent nucleoside transporter N-terminal domain-containing protein [Microcoleus sp.]
MQLILAILILKTAPGLATFKFFGDLVNQFLNFSDPGTKFVFGDKFTTTLSLLKCCRLSSFLFVDHHKRFRNDRQLLQLMLCAVFLILVSLGFKLGELVRSRHRARAIWLG